MKIITETNIRDFEFWSKARSNADLLSYSELDEIESIIVDTYPEGIDDTQLNDLFWHDFNSVLGWIGMSYDDLCDRGQQP